MQITQHTNTFLLRLIPQTSNYFRFSARWLTCSVFNVAIERKNTAVVVAAETIWKTFCAMNFSVRINVIYRGENKYFKMKKNTDAKVIQRPRCS